MTAVDRDKYMNDQEVQLLRTVTQAHAITDMQAGRVRGVLAWAVVDVALQTGLRVCELIRLNVGEFDAKRRALKAWRHKRREPVRETIALSKELSAHLNQFIEWKRSAGQATDKQSPMFVGKRGSLTVSGLERIWKAAVRRAGLPEELSIHSARHTIAVILLKKTGNLRFVQKQLGHASPATTANMYADISFEDMQDGLNGLYKNSTVGA